VRIYGAEPEGSPSLTRGIAAGAPVHLASITSKVQGLTPTYSGQINVDVCSATLDGTILLPDEVIFAGQKRLVAEGEVVEPAGAAAYSAVVARRLPAELLAGRTSKDPLRVAVVVSGGNPDPAQLDAVRSEIARERLMP